jgi:hypothetical protein
LKGRKVLSREEIEGELRDVFAKMSPVELERELNGAWRELVEEELANRLEQSLLGARRPVEVLTRDAPDDVVVALIDATPPPPPPLKANCRSRIAGVLRAIFKRKPH